MSFLKKKSAVIYSSIAQVQWQLPCQNSSVQNIKEARETAIQINATYAGSSDASVMGRYTQTSVLFIKGYPTSLDTVTKGQRS